MKKLISLFLGLVLVLGVCLTSCSKKDDSEAISDVTNKASESAITLAMYLMSEEEVSAEQAAKIEAAVNKITKVKFKTQMKLYFYTEEEYYEKLEAALKRKDEAVANGEVVTTAPAGDETTEAETVVNEYGLTELKYPEITDYQVDIFYFAGADRYNSYVDAGWLSRLDEELSSSSKALTSYITPGYLTYLKAYLSNSTYAIPNNRPIGEYTYLLLNKEVLNLTQYSKDDGFVSLTDEKCQDILQIVKENYSDKYLPLYSSTGKLDIPNFQYWGVDADGNLSNNFSVLGGYADPSLPYKKLDSYAPMDNTLANRTYFLNPLRVLKEYQEKGYYGTEADAGKEFAIGYVKGGADLVKTYGDKYEMVVVEKPTLRTPDLFEGMFGVAGYTADVSRSMQILTYLNTNEDFRNLILYGIEGENYEYIESDVEDVNGDAYRLVRRLNDSYMMDLYKTGNALIATPLEGEDPEIREYGKTQNRDARIDLAMNFGLEYSGYRVDAVALQDLRALSEEIYTSIMNCSVAELDDTIAAANTKILGSAAYRTLMTSEAPKESEESPATCSFRYLYYMWMEKMGIYKPAADEE